ncbi:alpha,alpha-trehalase [Pustulibacterium marinum]|uniref:Alpha,alpha-trehalase n=1 Tax=Pustulibacterium marinum TaxID=1224947 RepID=A0A1I7FTL6_9FLAO|nr:alpha,alpha-trehalase TreF [Pustulibacterium marinum]SFU39497.1 alpha,alpha-trehalase [Pustulibacterium marinum]
MITSFSFSCKQEAKKDAVVDFYESEFFKRVQMESIFKDSKTFVDMTPKISKTEILEKYELEKDKPHFNLEHFVQDYFLPVTAQQSHFITDTTKTMYEHISSMWPVLTRNADKYHPYSSLIPLPEPYVVPGGRFREIYYWDSYFTLQGLLVDGKEVLAKDMVDNFSFLIDTLGFIPNGNRNYYLSRSQPPFYAMMVHSVAKHDAATFMNYFPFVLKEYEYWMKGFSNLEKAFEPVNAVVKTDDDTFLNRYWSYSNTPREESYREDVHLAENIQSSEAQKELYRNLRSAAASGWDFSSRWFEKEDDFSSTFTTQLASVDLNCLLYFMETQLAEGFAMKNDSVSKVLYQEKANKRKAFIQKEFWNEERSFFSDFNLKTQKPTNEITLAGLYPLYFKIATKEQAEAVKNTLMTQFLKPGGLVTTLRNTEQQWDAPNGWAPLQYMAVHGLLHYGYRDEAKEIITRWLDLNERVYKNTGKMMEKYNVEDMDLLSGGGEYETQDGFGWTNGVALSFKATLDSIK